MKTNATEGRAGALPAEPGHAVFGAALAVLVPLARLLVARGLKFGQVEELLKQAFDVLSDAERRAAYDAGLNGQSNLTFRTEAPLQVEVALGSSRRNPVRILLTVIATLMIVGSALDVLPAVRTTL